MAAKWAELEVRRTDLFAGLQTGRNRHMLDDYLSVTRMQVAVERELGMTPATKRTSRPDQRRMTAIEAHSEIRQLYGRGQEAG